MDAKAFFELTAKVREAQKAYFRIPSNQFMAKQDALAKSKKLEAVLDEEIKRVKEITERERFKKQNPTLPGFDEDLLNRL